MNPTTLGPSETQQIFGFLSYSSVEMILVKDMQLPKGSPEGVAQLWVIEIRAVYPINSPVLGRQKRFELWVFCDQTPNEVESPQNSSWWPIQRRRKETFCESG